MEFIQIIYTSLLIFAGSVLIYLVTSFVLFKFKSITSPNDSSVNDEKQELKPILNKERRNALRKRKNKSQQSRSKISQKKEIKKEEKMTRLEFHKTTDNSNKPNLKITKENILNHYSDENHSDDLLPVKIKKKK